MFRVPIFLRAAIFGALAFALWRGAGALPEEAGVVQRSELIAAEAEVSAVLAGRVAARAVARMGTHPPDEHELRVIGALASGARVFGALPPGDGTLTARAPHAPRAGRTAAVYFTLPVSDGDSALVRLGDEAGVLDSVLASGGPGGRLRGGFRVRPDREGWHGWVVSARGLAAPAGAWARSARPLRVLVAAGPPDWESRFVARALEEAGAAVTLAQPLGHGLSSAGAASTLPSTAAELLEHDAVVVLSSASVSPGQARALLDFVEREGGGVLAAGQVAAMTALGIAVPAATAATTDAGAIRWSPPVEVVPLPAADLAVSLEPLRVTSPTAIAAATTSAGAVLVLSARGRGRLAALSVLDTWRWRMEAGRVEEHRTFWRSLTDWLAAGMRDSITVDLDRREGAEGTPVTVIARAASEDAQPPPRDPGATTSAPVPSDGPRGPGAPLVLRRPDGLDEVLPFAPAGPHRVARFLAAQAGVYTLRWATSYVIGEQAPADGSSPVAAFRAASEQTALPAPDGWAKLALLAHASGGGLLDTEDLARAIQAGGAAGSGRVPAAWLFAIIVALALTEWGIRRVVAR